MLYGKNIYLRELVREDIEVTYELCCDGDVLKYSEAEGHTTSKRYYLDNYEYLNKLHEKKYVVVNKLGKIVGIISYKISQYVEDVYVLSIIIGKKYWRKGYGSESIKVLLKYLFKTKKAHRVELEVVKDNIAAIECYKKIGFIKEGVLREKYYYNGTYLDTIIMGMLKNEYLKLRRKE